MAAVDNFKGRVNKDEPYSSAAAVSPNDGTDLTNTTRALAFVNSGAQTLKVDMADGQTVTFTGLPTGIHRLRVRRVWAAGTTVTTIVALW